ncbi:hypothetical protein M9H77_05224 [Catharanthus roseus]|uniref:Uncharacterized protein n=1 Tax=Catharanthus roseus TaxID=4058 RepID=A0ACC0CGX2_CATRO|nr:hypothetical protein M9H77_05224 [Catharanthus roseus]
MLRMRSRHYENLAQQINGAENRLSDQLLGAFCSVYVPFVSSVFVQSKENKETGIWIRRLNVELAVLYDVYGNWHSCLLAAEELKENQNIHNVNSEEKFFLKRFWTLCNSGFLSLFATGHLLLFLGVLQRFVYLHT